MIDPLSSVQRWRAWLLVLAGVAGCSGTGPDGADVPLSANDMVMVPAGGTVTVKGKPLGRVVVTFLPPSGPAVGLGETDADGRYELLTMSREGIPAGNYKVAVSYLISDRGVPQGIGARSSQAPGPGMLSAKEQFPPEYSDLGRTQLNRTVGTDGGRFDFDVPADIPITAEKPAADKTEASKTTGPKSTDSGAAAKPAEPKAAESRKE